MVSSCGRKKRIAWVPLWRHKGNKGCAPATVFSKVPQLKFPRTQIIALVNQKGGCGKTTSSVSIAAAFAKLGYSACIADTDQQCNATETFGIRVEALEEERRFTLVDAYMLKKRAVEIQIGFGDRFGGRLFVVPGSRKLSSVPVRLESELQVAVLDSVRTPLDADDLRNEQRHRLRNSLESLRGAHDVVIIDTPPSLDFLMVSALIAADWFLVPLFPSGYDLKGLEVLMKTVEQVRKRYNPTLRLAGVLLGNFDRTAALDKQVHEMLKGRFGAGVVFETTIGRSVRLREATVNSRTIFELENAEAQAQQFLNLVGEMINRGSKGDNALNPLPDPEVVARIANG